MVWAFPSSSGYFHVSKWKAYIAVSWFTKTSYVVCLCFGFLFFAVTDEDLTQFTSFFSTFLLVYLFDSF